MTFNNKNKSYYNKFDNKGLQSTLIPSEDNNQRDLQLNSLKENDRESFESFQKQELRESKVMVQEIKFHDEIMKQREADLLHIQKVSSQVKDMTDFMNTNTQEQGKMIGKFS